jgi:hypothetical protein
VKREWTETDFAELSWHDNSVHGLRIVEASHGAGELVLDLDYILEWLPAGGQFQFRIAPAELRFHEVTELCMSLDYAAASAALVPFTLDGIQRDSDSPQRWVLSINWPEGEISFIAAGYTQTLTGEPRITEQQSLSMESTPSRP